jgi:glycosyltransferase involved in cell wall biosynthesis
LIRVGIVLNDSWAGGVSYTRNLLNAVTAACAETIRPVLLAGTKVAEKQLSGFPDVEIVRTPFMDRGSIRWTSRKLLQTGLGEDPAFRQLAKRARLDVISHGGVLGRWANVPALCWIPDLQHRRLPRLFSAKERLLRDRTYRMQCRLGTLVIVSSEDARRDLIEFAPESAEKIRVLRFAVPAPRIAPTPLPQDIRLPPRYFHLPNQFWAHKNHEVVLRALAQAKSAGQPVHVVATGQTDDYRNPDFFPRLMKLAEELGVTDVFHVLGLVPLDALSKIMSGAMAIINPSLFEGWSTTVEEAKAMGKALVLSDIAVHREQAPEYGDFFEPHNPDALVAALRRASENFSEAVDRQRQADARVLAEVRLKQFGSEYARVVQDALSIA